MPRIAGIDIPESKRMVIALTYIFGVGSSRSEMILEQAKIDPNKRGKDLSEAEIKKIRDIIESSFTVEGELKSEIRNNIKRLIEIKSFRGMRHVKNLPVRGQRSKTNARTRKGKSKGQVTKKKVVRK